MMNNAGYDNGIETARHEIITKNTGIKIYFAIHIFPGKEVQMKIQTDSLEGIFLKVQTSIK